MNKSSMPSSQEREAALFALAVEKPVADREAFLQAVCGNEGPLRQRLKALLAGHDQPEALLGDTAGAHTATMKIEFAEEPVDAVVGQTLGRYKLLERVGEGGCGVVYVAEQTEPVRRRVALKVIKLGMDTKAVVARFEAERQALAMMDHPNIAKVLDAGATEIGRPYFVMELVRGIRITDYCDQNNLSTKERLDLFIKVCHAIQHAHQKGIIHRDIKPSNILVTLHDGEPVPKVIDFGIAKATEGRLSDATVYTQLHQFIGTPAYMSPEQAEMSGLDIDTRSDIYSLGVLLYELLAGSPPLDAEELMASGIDAMRKTIREKEPVRPSTRLAMLKGEELTTAAKRRSSDAPKLIHLLKGELDWIVMKALEKDRTRRYETANGLGMDIDRYLNGEAVLAAPPSRVYRFRKFIRRNRVMATTGGAVAAALLIGVIAFGWQANVARDQRDLAVRAQHAEAEQRKVADAARAEAQTQEAKAKEQEAEARKQAAIAEAVAKFQTDMLSAADPKKMLGDKVTVLQAMQGAVKELDQGSLKDQPLVEARVRNTIGTTLLELARYDDAEPNLRKSLAILRAAVPGHPDIAYGLNKLAQLLRAQNKFAEAESLDREALKIYRATLPAGHPDRAKALNNLAALLHAQNKLTEAEPLYHEALEIWRTAHPAGHPDVAHVLNNLAALLQAQNKLAEAEPLLREALEIGRAAHPAGHPNLLIFKRNLVSLYAKQGKTDEAVALLREVIEANRGTLPKDSPELAGQLAMLSQTLLELKAWDEAEPLLREALTIREKSQPDAWTTFNTKSMLGGVLLGQKKLTEAEPLLLEGYRGMKEREATPPQGRSRIPEALERLVQLYEAMGNQPEAAAWRSKLEAAQAEQAKPDAKKPKNLKL